MAEAEVQGTRNEVAVDQLPPHLAENPDFRSWVGALSGNEVDIWSQTMFQLRHHNAAIWSSVRLFFTINGLVATIMGVVGRQAEYVQDGVAVGALAIIGLVLSAIALRVLSMHWSTYLGVLVRKTLLENELGFYRTQVRGVDLSLPWSVEGSDGSLGALLRDPRAWYDRQRKWGGLLLLLSLMYVVVMAVYAAALVMVAIGFISGYFFEKGS